MRLMTPLLPWRPAILSPGCSLRFTATNTLTIFEHARRQLVAALELLDAVLEALDDDVDRLVILAPSALRCRPGACRP